MAGKRNAAENEMNMALNDNGVGSRCAGCHNPFFYKVHFVLCWLHPVHSED